MANLKRNYRNRGTVLIEAALILPILVLLVFGAMEYGWMFVKSGEVTNAARHGVRIGVLPDSTSADVTSDVASVMSAAGLAGKYTLTISPADVTTLTPGQKLTVTITVPYSNVTLTHMPLIPVPSALKSTVTMAKEGS